MPRPDLGDVATRARGLATRLLARTDLERLARTTSSRALAHALESVGYWPLPEEARARGSPSASIDASIEHETGRRLALLERWLGDRRRLFAGVFEEEERRVIRIRLRRLLGGAARISDPSPLHPFAPALRRMQEELAGAAGARELAETLKRLGSPYAEALSTALRTHGEGLLRVEFALDRAFATRARRAAQGFGGRLLEWVREGIDFDNAWSACAGQEEAFLEGGQRLSREEHASVAREADRRTRGVRLATLFERGALARVFDDPQAALATLESRALQARIAYEHRAGRLDPIGPSPILECVMRTRQECADLRRINWGIAHGLPVQAISGQLGGRG